MNNQEWLEQVEKNKEILRQFIGEWHPSSISDREDLPITAPNAEIYSEHVRKLIKRREKTDPVAKFDQALKDKDIGTLMNLFSGAWFGVPESTSCWRIEGFSQAVDLLDDPPEE